MRIWVVSIREVCREVCDLWLLSAITWQTSTVP